MTKFALGIGVALLIIVGALAALSFKKDTQTAQDPLIPIGQTHHVVLKSAGYEPEVLDIQKGDAVIFSTERTFEHWPASNQHPTHNLYADFDAGRPLSATETWQFQFTKTGSWEFHDHLNATYGGTINVIE